MILLGGGFSHLHPRRWRPQRSCQDATRRASAQRRLYAGFPAVLIAVLALSVALPSGADARVVRQVGEPVVGLQPREGLRDWEGELRWQGLGDDALSPEVDTEVRTFANPAEHPVMHSAAVYAIYWDPQDFYHGDWQANIDRFLASIGDAGGTLTNVFAADSQYRDSLGPATDKPRFKGAYTDTNPYPASVDNCVDPSGYEKVGVPLVELLAFPGEQRTVCLTDTEIREELQAFLAAHPELPTGMGTVYDVLTPPGVTVCLDSGGPSGRCSDFAGETTEIEGYYKEREESELAQAAKGLEPSEFELPTPPPDYSSYLNSFCSYHSAITTETEMGNAGTVLYDVLPWTAGGDGDQHLAVKDRTEGDLCQDGGFAAGVHENQLNGEREERERPHALTPREIEEREALPRREREEAEEAEALGLDGPHEQEPNQLLGQRGPDGGYDYGLSDLIVNQAAMELENTVTDPLLDAWQQQQGQPNEVTDECRNDFYPYTGKLFQIQVGTGAGIAYNQVIAGIKYYLNDTFNLAGLKLAYPGIPCVNEVKLEPAFTAPNPVRAGETVGLDGMESDVTLNWDGPSLTGPATYATYHWSFGDGTPPVVGLAPGAPVCSAPWLTPCAGSVFHTFAHPGIYPVALTIVDVGGNTATVVHEVTVEGTEGSERTEKTEKTEKGSAGASGVTGSTSAAGAPTFAAPTVQAGATSISLKTALKHGLAIRYVVNEQEAGVIEVLINAHTAKGLHIHAPVAVDLPSGFPRSLVIGRAVIVTQKGGTGVVHLIFPKPIAKDLAHVHKVALTLRIAVHNAGKPTPAATSLLSSFVLHN